MYLDMRKLRRNTSNKIIGGVCSGLADYSSRDISPFILRFIFVALAIAGVGFPVLLYIVLWITMPE